MDMSFRARGVGRRIVLSLRRGSRGGEESLRLETAIPTDKSAKGIQCGRAVVTASMFAAAS